jgi:hypothetical protein
MIQNAPRAPASASETLVRFARQLEPGERDDLKFRLALESADELENDFDVSHSDSRKERFFELLRTIAVIQPFHDRIPAYGIAYRGRPEFMTDALLDGLRDEAVALRAKARLNFEQYITRIETPDDSTVCEKLAASDELLRFVTEHAGPCLRSYVTSYIYYDAPGLCSKPHVDNAFTSVTVMIGLRHDYTSVPSSASVVYWADRPRLDYRLKPGELALFFGVSALHGRTPVVEGETVHSLLLSFRPAMEPHVTD